MLNNEELTRVKEAIRNAETQTSGEIRVCVARKCKELPLDAAYQKFKSLKMDQTALRNAVLIYVAPSDHKAAVVADSGINAIADDNYWDTVLETMMSFFQNEQICEGICRGVQQVGDLIQEKYPICKDDVNELCDEVIIDDNE